MKINYYQLSISQLHEMLKAQNITPLQLTKLVYQRLEKWKKLNAIASSLENKTLKKAKLLITPNNENLLWAIPFATKDNIITKNILTTASSHILDNFIPCYDSTVNSILSDYNALNIAKVVLDELGMGGNGLYASTGYVKNPWNQNYISGGSSSGSAVLVATGVVPFALGTDTGDSIRKPAAYCGVVGFKPTYGLISRYGVIPYAPSLDTVGIFTNNVEDVAIVFDALAKYDKKDATSIISKEKDYAKKLTLEIKDKKIAILNYDDYEWNVNVKTAFDESITNLKNAGCKVEKINFDKKLLEALSNVYILISCAEATSSHANLTGLNFGVRKKGKNFEEIITNSRTAGYGDIVKRRYIIGAYALAANNQEELLLKAKKIRRLIVEELNYIFKKYDAFIVMPTVKPAPTIQEIETQKHIISHKKDKEYLEDLLLLSNFNGGPSITIPLTIDDGLPIGININSAPLNDQISLDIAYFLSSNINFNNKLLGEENE